MRHATPSFTSGLPSRCSAGRRLVRRMWRGAGRRFPSTCRRPGAAGRVARGARRRAREGERRRRERYRQAAAERHGHRGRLRSARRDGPALPRLRPANGEEPREEVGRRLAAPSSATWSASRVLALDSSADGGTEEALPRAGYRFLGKRWPDKGLPVAAGAGRASLGPIVSSGNDSPTRDCPWRRGRAGRLSGRSFSRDPRETIVQSANRDQRRRLDRGGLPAGVERLRPRRDGRGDVRLHC